MKKNKERNLHERAEECRLLARYSCDERNEESKKLAIEEFEQGEVAKYFRENAAYV